jgi:Protein of unknown function (DUF3800)
MKKVIAFADEFGTNSFDFKTQSSHFIIASVIVNLDESEVVNEKLEAVRAKYFQKGEIKSNKVGENHKRRHLVLNALQDINFSIYAVVVDKEKLFGEGFKYKQSFYKFLNGILYKELYRTFPQLELKVDEHGGNDFMLSFKKYVQTNHIRNLFEGSEFHIRKSHSELGVQLADFIAGTLGYIFDKHKKSDESNKFLKSLSNKLISINHFPKEYKASEFSESELYSEFDETISVVSLKRIFDFIDKTSATDLEKSDQLNFMKLLVLFHQANHHKNYTTADEFIKHLNVNRARKIRKEQFATIVGALRDKGILIASSRDGYKVPTTAVEIKRYVQHGNSIVLPLLRRIDECRKAILLATNNSYDIVNDNEFKKLKKLIENIR